MINRWTAVKEKSRTYKFVDADGKQYDIRIVGHTHLYIAATGTHYLSGADDKERVIIKNTFIQCIIEVDNPRDWVFPPPRKVA